MMERSSEVNKLWDEIELMRGLSHPHIVEYIGCFVDIQECVLYIFQEWVPGGSIAHLLKKFNGPFALSTVRNYTRQILYGLQYLHHKNIVHRDIKGGNVLVDDNGMVKLADFGASTKLSSLNQTLETSTIQGTPYFMAPEVLASNRYGRKGDIWAVGCTMIQMLTGEPPWKDRNLQGIVRLHIFLSQWKEGPPPCQRDDLTPEARECLELCFKKDPDNRPTALELLKCRFLRDDELEDSQNHSLGGNGRLGSRGGTAAGGRSSSNVLDQSLGSTMGSDMLEDSGVMTGLKQEMAKAVRASTSGMGIRKSFEEDFKDFRGGNSYYDQEDIGESVSDRPHREIHGRDLFTRDSDSSNLDRGSDLFPRNYSNSDFSRARESPVENTWRINDRAVPSSSQSSSKLMII